MYMDSIRKIRGCQAVFTMHSLLESHRRDPKEPAQAILKTVISTDYRRAMSIPLVRGGGFTAGGVAPGAAGGN